MKIMAASDGDPKAARTLLVLAALMALGYLCIRTLRFTNDFLNVAFLCSFFLIPVLAARYTLRLGGWPKFVTTILLTPLLALSMLLFLRTVSCDLPAVVGHLELSRELAYVQQGNYSVHLLWEETAGGAIGPHGVGLEQRMFVVPGLYLVRYLDYFDEAHEGTLAFEGIDQVRVYIPKDESHREVNRVYALKRRLYF
jgi:hypothetical protein